MRLNGAIGALACLLSLFVIWILDTTCLAVYQYAATQFNMVHGESQRKISVGTVFGLSCNGILDIQFFFSLGSQMVI